MSASVKRSFKMSPCPALPLSKTYQVHRKKDSWQFCKAH
nr:MAG TPA: hypothetical protein [Caudoviricetes sp.]